MPMYIGKNHVKIENLIIAWFCFQTIKQSLAPLWDETLIFPPIDLHGTREDIKALPPKVVIEAFDSDMCVSSIRVLILTGINVPVGIKIGRNDGTCCIK